MNTICPNCDGRGHETKWWAVGREGDEGGGSAPVTVACKTCDGKGKLKGFKPPV